MTFPTAGHSDPEGEFKGGEIVCAIERSEDGYRFLVEHNGEIQLDENHVGIETARVKADGIGRGCEFVVVLPVVEQAAA